MGPMVVDDTPGALRIDGTYMTHGTNGADPEVAWVP